MRKIYHIWKKLAEQIGNFQATIVFSLLYLVIVTPIGLVFNLAIDIFDVKSKARWSDVEASDGQVEKMTFQ